MSRHCLAISIGVLLLSGLGCQHSTNRSAAVSSRVSSSDSTASDPQLHRAIRDAITLPDTDARTAAALLASDLQTKSLADTLSGIDGAIRIADSNLSHADMTAFKAVESRCDGDAQPVCTLDTTQGALHNTGRPLDVAIQGEGFFKIKLRDSVGGGVGYTRDGRLFVNDNGELVVGWKSNPTYCLTRPMTIPPGATDVIVSTDGQVSYKKAGKTSSIVAGQLQIAHFRDPQRLRVLDDNVYLQTDASGPAIESNPGENGAGQVVQNFLEASNVDINRERLRLDFLNRWRTTLLHTIDVESSPGAPIAR